MEHVEFEPDQASTARSAKRREMLCQSHEGCAAIARVFVRQMDDRKLIRRIDSIDLSRVATARDSHGSHCCLVGASAISTLRGMIIPQARN